MTDDEFIDLCYERILGRTADPPGRTAWLAELKAGRATRDTFASALLHSPESESQFRNREAFAAGDFFSALPLIEERMRRRRDVSREAIPGNSLRHDDQLSLCARFAEYHRDCPLVFEPVEHRRYYATNPAFGYSDAFVLYPFIRHFHLKRIVEVGSGFSSAAILDSLDALGSDETKCWFVEPYPALLHSLLQPQDERHAILQSGVQDVDPSVFSNLESGDILFIDSTHVSEVSSDVNCEIFEILPRLRPGVIIHIHDIYWPFEYPEEWIRDGRAWTEAYLVRASLQFNEQFRISISIPTFIQKCAQRCSHLSGSTLAGRRRQHLD